MTDKTVATEILNHLGNGRLVAMTGAKNFGCTENSLSFKIGRNAKGVNHVRITLNSMDTYDVDYIRIHGPKMTVKASSNGIYNDMLKGDFETNTGMYLTM